MALKKYIFDLVVPFDTCQKNYVATITVTSTNNMAISLSGYFCRRLWSSLPLPKTQTLLRNRHSIGTYSTMSRISYSFMSRNIIALESRKCISQIQSVKSRLGFLIFKRGFRTKKSQRIESENKEPAVKQLKPNSNQNEQSPSLIKPFVFTCSVFGSSFLGAMIWNYENMRSKYWKIGENNNKSSLKSGSFRQQMNNMWNQFSKGEKLLIGIVAANTAVFGLWKFPRLQSTMMQYFSSSIRHPLPSMLGSTFSHISPWHLFINMYVLWSFGSHVTGMYGNEQFSAVYLSGGVASSFASIAMSKLLKRPPSVSVGASGAIMALLGIVCTSHPNARLQIAFIDLIFPNFTFSADTGMKGIILFDVVGLALGWRVMDHAGHLGGMLFGILYAKFGSQLIWGSRESLVKKWHNFRGKP